MSPLDKRFTEGALRNTVALLLNPNGAGADLPDGNAGTIDSQKEAWMIPCNLLNELEEWWRQATLQQCVLFKKKDDGNYDYEDTYDQNCTAIRSTVNPNPSDPTRFDSMRTLGFWWFDAGSADVARRYTHCQASSNRLTSAKSPARKP
jgi:hypothetical protein